MRFILVVLAISLTPFAMGHGIDGCIAGNQMNTLYGGGRNSYLHLQEVHFRGTSQQLDFWGYEYKAKSIAWSTLLTGRVVLNEKWALIGFANFYHERQVGVDLTTKNSSLGDMRLMAEYSVIRMTREHKWLDLSLFGGLELPTGKMSYETYLRNFSVGSGSIDLPLGLNFSYRSDRNGLRAQSFYLFNGLTNFGNYQYGNMLSFSSAYFRSFDKLLLSCGAMVLRTGNDQIESMGVVYEQNNSVITGAITLESQYQLNKWGLGANLNLPLVTIQEAKSFDNYYWAGLSVSRLL